MQFVIPGFKIGVEMQNLQEVKGKNFPKNDYIGPTIFVLQLYQEWLIN